MISLLDVEVHTFNPRAKSQGCRIMSLSNLEYTSQNKNKLPVWWLPVLTLELERLGQKDCYEFESILLYKLSNRSTWVIV